MTAIAWDSDIWILGSISGNHAGGQLNDCSYSEWEDIHNVFEREGL